MVHRERKESAACNEHKLYPSNEVPTYGLEHTVGMYSPDLMDVNDVPVLISIRSAKRVWSERHLRFECSSRHTYMTSADNQSLWL